MALIQRTLNKPGGTDYTVITEWESDEGALHVAGDDHELQIYAGDETAYLYTDGWANWNGTETVFLTAIDRHDGVSKDDGGTGYRISSGGTYTIRCGSQNLTIDGIEILNTVNNSAVTATASYVVVKNCMAFAPLATGYTLSVGGSVGGVVENTLLVGGGVLSNAGELLVCRFVTVNNIAGSAYSINLSSNATVENCAAIGASNVDLRSRTSPNVTNNVTGDSSAENYANGISGLDLTPGVDFVDPTVGNYNPAPGGRLENNGVTIAGVTTDISDYTRESPPEVGAYEIQGGAVKIENMHVKDSDAFVKAAPHVRDGGAWVAVDAYVRDGGVWVQVHEK